MIKQIIRATFEVDFPGRCVLCKRPRRKRVGSLPVELRTPSVHPFLVWRMHADCPHYLRLCPVTRPVCAFACRADSR